MTGNTYRFFRELVPTAEFQVPEHQATNLAAYARGVFAPDGTLMRIEMYTHKGLVRVEYRTEIDALPGVPFDVRVPAGPLGNLRWSVLRRYDAKGTLGGFLVQLQDGTERSLMEVSYSPVGGLEATMKFAYEPSGELRYLFDYDEHGKLVDLFDRIEADSPGFALVLDQLADRAFYAQGSTLPAGHPSDQADIPGGIVRRELGRPDPIEPLTRSR